MNLFASIIDELGTTLAEVYPKFQEYAKLSILYIAAAGIMIQVIKSMRG
jgi:hypothetical protein